MSELKRSLNVTEVVFFAAGVILGAGIYTVIGKAAGESGNMLWLSFSIAALTAILTLFAYAELCALFPSSGGEFSFVKEAVSIRWAFVVGSIVALSGIISAATISIGFAGYFAELTDFPERIAAILIIGLIFIVNIIGIKGSSTVNIIFTILETCGLLFVIYTAAPELGKVSYVEMPPNGLHGILTGAAICFFAFTGFEDAVKLAEETKNPEKNIPKGLFIASAIVTVIYLAVALVVISMIPFNELGASDSPLSLVLEKRFGKTGGIIIAIVALFSTSNSLLSNMLGSSRVLYNFGKESKKVSLLSKVSGRKAPYIALIIAALCTCAFSLIGDVKSVALLTNFLMFITFIIINCTVIYLRFKNKNERPFKIPLNINNIPVISVLAIILTLILLSYTVYGLLPGNLTN